MTDLTPRARELLDSTRRAPFQPTAEALERMETGVAFKVGISFAARAATAKGSGLVATAGSKVLLTTVMTVLTVAAAAGGLVYRKGTPESPPPAPAVPLPPPVVVAENTQLPVTASTVVAAPTRRNVRKTKKVPAPNAAPRDVIVGAPALDGGVRSEAASLRAILDQLDGLAWSDALASLNQHDVEFAGGALADEAAVLRILALCGLEQFSQAAEVANQLRQRSEQSPSLSQLSTSCASP